MKIIVSIIAITVICSGCVGNIKIAYRVDDVKSNYNEKLTKVIFDIEEFADKRKNSADTVLYENTNVYKKNGVLSCINSQRYYKKVPVATQFTQLLVDHLDKRNSFKKVVKNKKDTADYYLTGNLVRFYGEQEFSMAALTGEQFGIIGAVATANVKTKGKVVFEISDLKIYDRNHQVVKDLGVYRREYDEAFPGDAHCWCIYTNVNTKLKEYFSDLITTVETEIRNVK